VTFESICRLGELSEGKPAKFDVAGKSVSVVLVAGVVHAVDDTCSHAEVSLSEGEVDDCTIECWLHGSRFDLRSGAPTGLPATKPIAVYQVRQDGVGPDSVVLIDTTN
jgi:3-phenylpropionate/trans-cinnamate dioxygenase ferredoxin subunit